MVETSSAPPNYAVVLYRSNGLVEVHAADVWALSTDRTWALTPNFKEGETALVKLWRERRPGVRRRLERREEQPQQGAAREPDDRGPHQSDLPGRVSDPGGGERPCRGRGHGRHRRRDVERSPELRRGALSKRRDDRGRGGRRLGARHGPDLEPDPELPRWRADFPQSLAQRRRRLRRRLERLEEQPQQGPGGAGPRDHPRAARPSPYTSPSRRRRPCASWSRTERRRLLDAASAVPNYAVVLYRADGVTELHAADVWNLSNDRPGPSPRTSRTARPPS